MYLKDTGLNFPGGPVIGNAPANAGDTGSIPCLGGFHMPSLCTTQTSLHAITTDARAPKAVLRNKRRPHLLQPEKACTQR